MKHKYIAKRYWNDEPNVFSAEREVVVENLINLNYGDPDFTTSELILNPTFEDIRNGHTHYGDLCGYGELRDLIVRYLKEDYALETDRSEIYVTNGAGHGLMITLESILDDGDEVIIHEPYYAPYPEQIVMARGIPVIVPTYEKDGFQPDPDIIEKHVTNRTKAILLNYPNNPTGANFSEECLRRIGDIAEKYDLILLCDVAYSSLVFNGEFVPMVNMKGLRERTVTLFSASKEFAMTGWRVGFNHAPDYLVERMKRVNENDTIMGSSIAQRAYIHAIKNRHAVRKEIRQAFKERMDYAYARIQDMKNMDCVIKPDATFYLFPGIRETGLKSAEVSEKIYEEAKVALFPGSAFGDSGEGYLRIACTQEKKVLEEAFDRMSKMDIFKG